MLGVDIIKKLPDFNLKISFAVGRDILVLLGPSGSGKTTVLRCVAGLVRPDGGRITSGREVFYDGSAGVFMPPRRRQVGYMFQDFALFPNMDVRANIWYGVKRSGSRAAAMYEGLLELLKIGHLAGRYPGCLSGGEMQRVAFARALMAEPRIMLLDEPFSALDGQTRGELQAELKKLQRLWNIPFILVTHDRKEARLLGDRILFIENGRQSVLPPAWQHG